MQTLKRDAKLEQVFASVSEAVKIAGRQKASIDVIASQHDMSVVEIGLRASTTYHLDQVANYLTTGYSALEEVSPRVANDNFHAAVFNMKLARESYAQTVEEIPGIEKRIGIRLGDMAMLEKVVKGVESQLHDLYKEAQKS
jgi:hypothetical protein